ncbi:hypothetical protein AUJ14_04620 [Candidatus Micrarchaeota archaeon CG1_02_55_22]|nr:MAG: hypothetical protein AUJ14_04620 [Candidatus Micrarchaeota archaeon CG1_02_55_22]
MQTTLFDDDGEAPRRTSSFQDECKRVGNAVLGFESVLVCHHYDADGLSSGGLVANVLRRANKRYATLSLKRVDDETVKKAVETARAGNFTALVFVDLGAGQIGVLEKLVAPDFNLAVIDHHVPQKDAPGILHANPELHGYSGSTDACGASTAFYCFRDALWRDSLQGERDNWDLVYLAVVGAVGDMQDNRGLVSLNAELVSEAVERGLIEKRRDLRMFGRVSRNLVNFLSFSSEPLIDGLTGDAKGCALLLEDAGIEFKAGDKFLHYNDLDGNVRKQFVSVLVNRALAEGVEPDVVERMVGEVYVFPRQPVNTELYDAYEFSTLLNACGRHGHEELGIRVCLREPGAFEESKSVLQHHRLMISKGISYARRHCSDFGPFYFVDARGKVEDTVIGTVIGGFYNAGVIKRDKPILGFSLDEKAWVKISSRGIPELVEKGLDLNLVMRTASESVGGLGGGHKIAAGASVPAGKEAEFLLKCKELLEGQLRSVD